MTIDPDDYEFDFERSRAAVAVACLEWLRCTGPTSDREIPDEVEFSHDKSPIDWLAQAPERVDAPHPLWDRWLDG